MKRARAISAATVPAVLLAVLATGALAETRGRARPKAGKPPVTTTAPPALEDAGAASPDEASADAGAPPGDAGVPGDGGIPPYAVIPKVSFGDGGVKASPLNPTPPELPNPQPTAAPNAAEVDALLGEVSALRARVAAVGDALFHARVALALKVEGHAKVGKLTVSLDDGVVYTAPAPFPSDDDTRTVYEHGVAPGRHAVTVDIDRGDVRDESFRTAQRSRFVVEVPKDARLEVELRVSDDSDMGEFPAEAQGGYDLRVRLKAVARKAGR